MAKLKYFMNTRVAGFQYHEGLVCLDGLKVGAVLTLQREQNNCYDHNAVALYCGEHKIGYLPQDDNEDIAIFFDMGHTDLFEARINRVKLDEHPEHQISITIFVKGKE